jgi:preprotein translocase subunit SecF
MEDKKQEKSAKKPFGEKFGEFHDRHYKNLLFLPIAVLLLCAAYMFFFYSSAGDIIIKDFSLIGGTSITVQGSINADDLKSSLSGSLDEIETRVIYDLATREQTALVIQTKTSSEEAKKILEGYLSYELNDENSSIEFISPSIGSGFYRQLLMAIGMAFVLMGLVVFVIFRKAIPSLAVIVSAFADIFMTLAMVNLLGIKMSSAGLVAFLMLVGYSVDTDILLTNRVLKSYHGGTLNQRIIGAFKTGMTMTLTSLIAVVSSLLIVRSFSIVLSQIFTVLAIGLCFDIFNTWVTNVSLIKWYIKKNEP